MQLNCIQYNKIFSIYRKKFFLFFLKKVLQYLNIFDTISMYQITKHHKHRHGAESKEVKIMSRVAHDAITGEFLGNDVVRLENIDHGNYKFFNQSTIDNIVALTANNSNSIKNQTGAYTNIAYQIKMNIAYNLHDMMQLAFYGWSIDKVTNHTVTLTSYKAVKLQALSKQIANIKVNNITVNRIDIDDNSILSKFNGLNKDIIKECQRLDRGFIARVVTDRQDNITKHTFAK